MMNRSVEIIFIRHGKTRGNEERRYIGRTDEPLSQNGREEIQDLHDSGILPDAEQIFVSPMKRCIETAAILYPGQKVCPIEDFREIEFGDFEGKNADELLADSESGYQTWIDSGGTMTFPHGEARDHFIQRCRRGFEEMMSFCWNNLQKGALSAEADAAEIVSGAEKNVQPGALCRAASIVHGGTIMSILSGLCGGDYYDYMCRNGEGFRLKLYQSGDGWKAAAKPERISPSVGK